MNNPTVALNKQQGPNASDSNSYAVWISGTTPAGSAVEVDINGVPLKLNNTLIVGSNGNYVAGSMRLLDGGPVDKVTIKATLNGTTTTTTCNLYVKAAKAIVDNVQSGARCLLGIYSSNDSKSVPAFRAWLGKNEDLDSVHCGYASQSDFETSPSWCAGQVQSGNGGTEIIVSAPLLYTGMTLSQAAQGAMDASWTKQAQSIISVLGGQARIILRTGWEFNLSPGFPWAVDFTNAQMVSDFNTAWRRFVACYRAVSAKFLFVWCPNKGGNYDPTMCWPGADVVDIVSMDAYEEVQYGDIDDPYQCWLYNFLEAQFGLQWLVATAQKYGKPAAISEWGISQDNWGVFLKAFQAWCNDPANGLIFVTQWNSNSGYSSLLTDGHLPGTAQAFRVLYNPAGYPNGIPTGWQKLAGDDFTTLSIRKNDKGTWEPFYQGDPNGPGEPGFGDDYFVNPNKPDWPASYLKSNPTAEFALVPGGVRLRSEPPTADMAAVLPKAPNGAAPWMSAAFQAKAWQIKPPFYVEWLAKVPPGGPGQPWSGYWVYCNDRTEVDAQETFNASDVLSANLHWPDANGNMQQLTLVSMKAGCDLSQAVHKYALIFTETDVTILFDDMQVGYVKNPPAFISAGKLFNIIANQSSGIPWNNAPPSGPTPNDMLLAGIHAYAPDASKFALV